MTLKKRVRHALWVRWWEAWILYQYGRLYVTRGRAAAEQFRRVLVQELAAARAEWERTS